jgi:hypothetical protein
MGKKSHVEYILFFHKMVALPSPWNIPGTKLDLLALFAIEIKNILRSGAKLHLPPCLEGLTYSTRGIPSA